MFSDFANNKAFTDRVYKDQKIYFSVRGTLTSHLIFEFPDLNLVIQDTTIKVNPIAELPDGMLHGSHPSRVEHLLFGHVDLLENSIEGIRSALSKIDLWADFMALIKINAVITIEPDTEQIIVFTSTTPLTMKDFGQFNHAFSRYEALVDDEKKDLIRRALWWYRKAGAAFRYSIFDSYAAYWNVLEIMCGVSVAKPKTDDVTFRKIRETLEELIKIEDGKIVEWRVKPGHIQNLYEAHVKEKILNQMELALPMMLGEKLAKQYIEHCFTITPMSKQLYKIRNDINHGNILETDRQQLNRIYPRHRLLGQMAMFLLATELGFRMPLNANVNMWEAEAEQVLQDQLRD